MNFLRKYPVKIVENAFDLDTELMFFPQSFFYF